MGPLGSPISEGLLGQFDATPSSENWILGQAPGRLDF